ncbi:hypothetical protein EYF80_047799 [Liparis tanakae]|uniref:Uncharacterized protein n=1 Tax=Liparis tanakae TaxID=230148 RepID=A0A4Z2FM84_9TELE|nr:hypothetical protein EYF80_047799 [Liparis tanakae]
MFHDPDQIIIMQMEVEEEWAGHQTQPGTTTTGVKDYNSHSAVQAGEAAAQLKRMRLMSLRGTQESRDIMFVVYNDDSLITGRIYGALKPTLPPLWPTGLCWNRVEVKKEDDSGEERMTEE